MKYLLIYSLFLISTSVESQTIFQIDWAKTPISTLDYPYTLNHFRLSGKISKVDIFTPVSKELTTTYEFNREGKLILYLNDEIALSEYQYDSYGKLVSMKDWLGEVNFITDANGRITTISFNTIIDRYIYNSKGDLIEIIEVNTGKIKSKFYYDSQSRLIKNENYSNGEKNSTTTYSYTKFGNKTIVSQVYLNHTTNTPTSSTLEYDQRGNKVGTEYDRFGNIIKDEYGNNWKITYWDGTITGGTTQTTSMNTSSTTNQKPVTTTQIPQTTTQNNNNTSTLGCLSGNCNNGWGKWQYENGEYEGFWVNGKRTGYGLYNWKTEGSYVGFFNENKLEGYGSYENKEGLIKRGIYTGGMLNGLGEQVTKDKKWDQGTYTNHNLTKSEPFNSNNVSTGCLAGNCTDGYGQFKWANGDLFTGFFKAGKQHLGTYTFSTGDAYYGLFNSNGQMHGQGRLIFKDGSYYGGEFKNGTYNGRGYFYDKNKIKKIGVWTNGTLTQSLN